MQEIYEISDRFIEAGDANELLYEPLKEGLTFRRTRRYEIDFDGDKKAVKKFVKETLLDPISQEFHKGEKPALKDSRFFVEYGMKPGALDLEKEAILTYYRGIEEPGFTINDLKIRQRIYVFGKAVDEKVSDKFVRDICNRAIHNWSVIQGNV